MSDHTLIEWTDATWNPITGCSVVSPGCKNCYAMKLAGTRLQHHTSRANLTQDSAAGPVWTGEVRFNAEWLDQPTRWRKPRNIFVCAHGDLFHESVPDAWIDKVFAVMQGAGRHTFQVLTKRADRMRAYVSRFKPSPKGDGYITRDGVNSNDRPPGEVLFFPDSWPLPNVWLGVSVEDQQRANERVPHLLSTPAAVRWVSAEPLLSTVDLTRVKPARTEAHGSLRQINATIEINAMAGTQLTDMGIEYSGSPRIDWVVAGGESGHAARPMHPSWARSLRDQCAKAGVAFHFKQWGEWAPHQAVAGGDEGGDLRRGHVRYLQGDGREPDGHFRRGDAAVARIGKKAAGRHLDGRTHDEWPRATA